jgi:hypothetical protein
MNKLRRNNFNSRLTVENMRACECFQSCSDYCFMIACICDNLKPEQNESTYETNHDNANFDGSSRLTEIYTA